MIEVTVKTLDSQNHAFTLEDDQITVKDFKEHIAEAVSVPAETQRLIYCGKVLRNEKKLNDYDVNGKVIHLVQRAPPQPGQRRNYGGQTRNQNYGLVVWRNLQSPRHRLTRTQLHGNTMSVPAEIVEGHALPIPQLSNTLSYRHVFLTIRMLHHANLLIERLSLPNLPAHPQSSENNQQSVHQQTQGQRTETEHPNNNSRASVSTRFAEATAAAWSTIQARNARLHRAGNSDEAMDTTPANDVNEENQPNAQPTQQPSSEQQGSTSNSEGLLDSLPRAELMAELLDLLMYSLDNLRPYFERYRALMLADEALPHEGGPGSAEESQRLVDSVSEGLHYLSHACHALSDIIVDMNQQPPRNLRCRPVIIQQSTILQPGVPIQAHFSIHGQNTSNNNSNEENTDSASTVAQPELNETNVEENSQHQESEGGAQQQQPELQQEQPQPPFGTVFNLSNDMVLMEVSPEGNFTTGNEQFQSGENNNNNNNNNGGRAISAAGFVRSLVQALAGHIVPAGITTATITSQSLPTTGGPQTSSTHDGNTSAGQSTQARSNVDTRPTTATQTRSTSRQQVHPLSLGMSLDQGLEFDPFLPCNSHHIRRSSAVSSSPTISTSQRVRTSQVSTTETQPQTQTATTSATTTSNTNSTNTTASSSQANPLMRSFQQRLGEIIEGQLLAAFGNNTTTSTTTTTNTNTTNTTASSSQASPLMRSFQQRLGEVAVGLDLARQMILFVGPNIDLTAVVERNSNLGMGTELLFSTLADTLEPSLSTHSQNTTSEPTFLCNLFDCAFQNFTLFDLWRLHRRGEWGLLSPRRMPLMEFLENAFPDTSAEELPEQAVNRAFSEMRPILQSLFATANVNNGRNGLRIDICATIEALLQRHIKHIVQLLLNDDVSDNTFAQETFNILQNLKRQLLAVLQHSIQGGLPEFVAMLALLDNERVQDPASLIRLWVESFISDNQNLTQLSDSESLPLLIYKDIPLSQPLEVPSDSTQQPNEAQSEVEPMETEVVEEKTNFEYSLPDDNEELPETFPVLETLPSDWVPIIARDGVRQRRQLLTQGMTNGSVTTLSDAYLGTLPTKRRKLIEQQKPRLLVSPTPNHSAISASMERLVRESVNRAGVEEVEGAAVAVAVDPGVRRAFGQAIRDCLNPRRYETPDFPDPLRFPNATKYFADQDRPPK